tara:strand:- start:39 stop:674 length:636 start_codon:yes stop_codon:yes gene_type:complete
MMIIGKVAEYRSSFPQRSSDHTLLSNAMRDEGWTRDVIDNNLAAYKEYKRLMNNHSDWHPLAQAASVTHLMLMARDENGMTFNLVKYLKRNKHLPPVSALRGYLGGYFDENFEPRSKGRPKSIQDKPSAVSSSTAIKNLEVTEDDTSSVTEVLQEVTEDEKVTALISVVESMDLEAVYIDDVLKARLEVIKQPLMTLAHLAIPIPKKPTYV